MKYIYLTIVLMVSSWMSYGQTNDAISQKALKKLETKKADFKLKDLPIELQFRQFTPIYRSFDKWIENAFESTYYDDEAENAPSLDTILFTKYVDSLRQANKSPSEYHFDLTQVVEIIDYNNQRSFIKIHHSDDQPYIAVEQQDQHHNKHIIVYDATNNAYTKFTYHKSGKKSYQIIPYRSTLEEFFDLVEAGDCNFKVTDNTKKILGYTLMAYKGYNSTEKISLESLDDLHDKKYYEVYQSIARLLPPAMAGNLNIKQLYIYNYDNTWKEDPTFKTTFTTLDLKKVALQINTSDFLKK